MFSEIDTNKPGMDYTTMLSLLDMNNCILPWVFLSATTNLIGQIVYCFSLCFNTLRLTYES